MLSRRLRSSSSSAPQHINRLLSSIFLRFEQTEMKERKYFIKSLYMSISCINHCLISCFSIAGCCAL
jgi:hypothetical protein